MVTKRAQAPTKIAADLRSIASAISTQVAENVKKMEIPPFVPTGALEDAIKAVGSGQFRIVNVQCANKLGKTALIANIFKNIFWEYDPVYFDYPAYREWPFRESGENGEPGNIIKRARIICTPENAKEGGPIETEIKKWWPEGRYTRAKGDKHYYSKYETDTGWTFDILTFDQEPSAHEGPLISLQWCDEPPRARLMGAIMSRFSKGGVLLMSQTPVNAGAVLDLINDLAEKGARVFKLVATIYDNSITKGKLNSTGTKRGLMTDEEIEDYAKTIPVDEQEARLFGRSTGKTGKIYTGFSNIDNVRHYSFASPAVREWNGYCIMDPHDKYYPFIQWWAVLPPGLTGKSTFVCYNEWPNIETLGGYYDEKRKSVACNLTPERIARIIKLLDGTQYGIKMVKRGIDPRFARNSEVNYTKQVEGLVLDYHRHGIDFELPDLKLMSTARDRARDLMKFDKDLGVSAYNEPQILFMPHCVNSIRAVDRHYWEEGTDTEAEQYKDACDCMRMFLALEAGQGWMKNYPVGVKKEEAPSLSQSGFFSAQSIGDCSLV